MAAARESRDGPWRVARRAAIVSRMATDTRQASPVADDSRDLVVDVVQALQPRLKDLPEESLRRMVQSALDAMGDVRVTTYLPILIERKVRDDLRHRPAVGDEVIRLPA